MAVTGNIVSLDVGTLMGVAVGKPGDKSPESWTVQLKKGPEGRDVAFSNCIWVMGTLLRERKAQVVFKEAAFLLAAMQTHDSSDDQVRFTYGLHAVIEGMARRFGVPVVERHRSQILKHFTGRGRFQSRQEGKRAVIQRCIQLGWLEDGCADDDRADACAGWEYACAHLGRKPGRLVLT